MHGGSPSPAWLTICLPDARLTVAGRAVYSNDPDVPRPGRVANLSILLVMRIASTCPPEVHARRPCGSRCKFVRSFPGTRPNVVAAHSDPATPPTWLRTCDSCGTAWSHSQRRHSAEYREKTGRMSSLRIAILQLRRHGYAQ